MELPLRAFAASSRLSQKTPLSNSKRGSDLDKTPVTLPVVCLLGTLLLCFPSVRLSGTKETVSAVTVCTRLVALQLVTVIQPVHRLAACLCRLRVLAVTCKLFLQLTEEHLVARAVARYARKWRHRTLLGRWLRNMVADGADHFLKLRQHELSPETIEVVEALVSRFRVSTAALTWQKPNAHCRCARCGPLRQPAQRGCHLPGCAAGRVPSQRPLLCPRFRSHPPCRHQLSATQS